MSRTVTIAVLGMLAASFLVPTIDAGKAQDEHITIGAWNIQWLGAGVQGLQANRLHRRLPEVSDAPSED